MFCSLSELWVVSNYNWTFSLVYDTHLQKGTHIISLWHHITETGCVRLLNWIKPRQGSPVKICYVFKKEESCYMIIPMRYDSLFLRFWEIIWLKSAGSHINTCVLLCHVFYPCICVCICPPGLHCKVKQPFACEDTVRSWSLCAGVQDKVTEIIRAIVLPMSRSTYVTHAACQKCMGWLCVCVGLGTTGEKYAYCVTVWDPCVRGWHRQNMLMSASACVLAEACHLILWCCSLYVQQCGSHSLLLYSPLISSPQGNVCVHIYFYFLYDLCTVNTSITSVQINISDIQYMVMCFGTLVVGVCADVPLSFACLM